jgi:hypothetical protein
MILRVLSKRKILDVVTFLRYPPGLLHTPIRMLP